MPAMIDADEFDREIGDKSLDLKKTPNPNQITKPPIKDTDV
jgi:hypothetical protein